MRSTHISGKEPDYANYHITLYKTIDPFGLLPQNMGMIKVDQLGNFELDVVLTQTTYIYADFDRWHTSTILEPGGNYTLQLPPHKPLAEAEKRSPFFSKSDIPLGLKELPIDDINRQIQAFEIAFAKTEDKYFEDLFVHKSKAALQALKSEILQEFPAPSYTFFGQYIYYRLASVEYKLRMTDDSEFIQTYMNVESLPFNNPPFNKLYKEVFTNYFYKETVLNNNKELKRQILSGKLSNIEDYLYHCNNWGDNLRRITILDAINDSFYLNLYHKDLLLNLLKQVEQSRWTSELKKLAHKLYLKLTFLAVGSEAPNLVLKSYDNVKLNLADTFSKEKFNFLHFSNTNNPISRSNLEQITQQYDKYKEMVEFIIVMPASCKTKINATTLASWKGKFFFADDNELAKYDIKSFPYSFIINKDGKLLISPALNPLDGMTEQLNKTIFNWKREEMNKTQ